MCRKNALFIFVWILATGSVFSQAPSFLWADKGGGANDCEAHGIGVDADDNVIITGGFDTDATFGGTTLTSNRIEDLFLAKYDSSGNFQWAAGTDGPLFFSDAIGYDVATDANGNIYLTGSFSDTTNFGPIQKIGNASDDFFLARYSAAGTPQWVSDGGDIGFEIGRAVAIDGSGDLVCTGRYSSGANFGGTFLTGSGSSEILVVKYSSGGAFTWAKGFSSDAGGFDIGFDIATSGTDMYVTGSFEGTIDFGGTSLTSAGGKDIFLTKLDANGDVTWAKSAGSSGDDEGFGVAVNSTGEVVITGTYADGADFSGTNLSTSTNQNVFVAKYSAAGALVWVKSPSANSPGGTATNRGNAVTIDPGTNSIVIGGQYIDALSFGGTTLNSSGGFLAEYTNSGLIQWAQDAGASANDVQKGTNVNFFATGVFDGSANLGGIVLNSGGGDDAWVGRIGAFAVSREAWNPVIEFGVFPNPFENKAIVEYQLESGADMMLEVTDIYGKTMRTLHAGPQTAGRHRHDLEATGLAAGMYYVSIRTGGAVTTVKVLLSK